MRQFVKTAELCEVMKVSRKQLLERARREKWPLAETSGGVLFVADRLPVSVQMRLTERSIAEHREKGLAPEQQGIADARQKDRDTAAQRAALIVAFRSSGMNADEFIRLYNRQETARALYARLGSVSVPSFYRWLKAFKESGAQGLLPRQSRGRGGSGATLSAREKELLKAFWLDSTQPSMQHALRKMLLACPESRCTYETARRFLSEIPPTVRDFYRLGQTRWENMYLPYTEQAVAMYSSLDCVVSDHHCLDCVVMYRGRLIRPWLTTFQDYRSGKVLGWCPCVTPSSLSIIVAYYMVCWYYGVPPRLLFDNGKDYRSKLLNGWKASRMNDVPDASAALESEETEISFAGIFATLGSDVHFTRTYHGMSKGRQERYFRIIGEYLAKDIGSYVGSDSRSRPEESQLMFRALNGKERRTDIPEWEDFVRLCNTMIPYINDKFVSEGKGIKGMTRSEAFEKFKTHEFRRVSKEELQAALCSGSVRKCGRNGVTVGGIHYWNDALAQYVGCNVVVRTKLVFDNKALVYTTDGRFICECEGDYFCEDRNDMKSTFKKVEGAKKHSFALAAELGATGEVALDADAKIMHKVAAGIYDQSPDSIDDILGISWDDATDYDNAESGSNGAHRGGKAEKPKNKYKSALEADEMDYIDIPNLNVG